MIKMESKFSEFQNLTHFQLWNCENLEELSYVHKLRSLKQIDIFYSPKLKKFPIEFSEVGVFPSF
jgi:hypothetical protein